MLRNPFLLISSSTSGGDGANRGTDRSLRAGLFGMGDESVVSVVEQTTKERSYDGVGRQANKQNQLDAQINIEKSYSFRSNIDNSGSTTVMTESYTSTLYVPP